MLTEFGNLWKLTCDARAITTNGYVKANGEGVMGAGVALQAKKRYPHLPRLLGDYIKRAGNHVGILLDDPPPPLVAFPVKRTWAEGADINLIRRSCGELMALADMMLWERVLLPRPGAGNGRLDYDIQVRPVIEPLLDDRIVVIDLTPSLPY